MLTAAVLFAASTIANAQLFVGGNLGFGLNSTNKTEMTTGGTTTKIDPIKTMDFTISPRVGYALNEKMACGLDLLFHMNNTSYPDDYEGLTETNHKYSTTNFGAGVFFRYSPVQIGQFSLFAEATAGVLMGSGKEEYKIANVTTSVDVPKTTDIFAMITPGVSYKMNEKLQFDAYLGLCQLSFAHSVSTTEGKNSKKTVTDDYFNLGINQHTYGNVIQLGMVYNF